MNNFIYIPLVNNSKKPAKAFKHLTATHPEIAKFENRAILTGTKSDVIVVDIDKFDTWNEYIKDHGEPQTLKAKSPKGFHYYFKYTEKINSCKVGIRDGIDIRSNGGIIVCEPSKINDKVYKFVDKNAPIADIPEELFLFLYVGQDEPNPKKQKPAPKEKAEKSKPVTPSNDIYYIDDNDLKSLLDKLPRKYCDNRLLWLSISDVLKGMDNYKAFENFSMKSSKYNKEGNDTAWDSLRGNLNINYIINIINTETKNKIKYIQPTISYKDIETIPCEQRVLTKEDLIDNRYLNIKKYIKKYTCLLVKSDTGTGKTTSTANYMKDLKKVRIISIVSRISLGEQQVKTFKDANIVLKDYRNTFDSEDNVFIQLDSILKLQYDSFENCVIYLDEVNSLIQYLIDSTTLNTKRINIFAMLSKIIKQSKIVIGTDADISTLTFKYFDKLRDNMQYIYNPFKNYNNIVVNQYKDEQEIIDKMKQQIKDKKYFLCAFDSKTRMEQVFEMILDSKQKNDFIKYSADEGELTADLVKQWSNKYVLYTPRIIYGVDFNPPTKTDVFIISQCHTINCIQIAQQMTRCRNIKEVNFYFANIHNQLKFKTVDDVKDYYEEFQSHYETILNQYGHLTIDEDFKVKYNSTKFTELFYLHKLNENILRSNYIYHFIQTCKSKGMVINIKENTYNSVNDKEAKAKAKKRKDELIDNVLDNELETSQIFKSISKRLDICKISIDEMNENVTFKQIITDDHNFSNHLNICKMVEKEGELNADLSNKAEEDFKEHVIKSTIAKVQFIKKLESILKIDSFDIDYDKHQCKYNNEITVNDSLMKLYQKVFSESNKKLKCENFYDVYKTLINCYKNLFGGEIVITEVENKRIDKKFKRITKHTINKKLINEHLQLLLNRRKSSNIDEKICKQFDIEIKPKDEYLF